MPDCNQCDGSGIRVVCPDDICRGRGECMHGDGEIICYVCKGDGWWKPTSCCCPDDSGSCEWCQEYYVLT